MATKVANRATAAINRQSLHQVHLVFGANTDVGKSIVSTGLIRAAGSSVRRANYIKPLQCGGSDEAFVLRYCTPNKRKEIGSTPTGIYAQTLFRWETPVSPHLASRLENQPVGDDEVLAALRASLNEINSSLQPTSSSDVDLESMTTTIIETAGGVLSPSSSAPENNQPQHAREKSPVSLTCSSASRSSWGWSTQADLYSPLNIPAVLVGDGRLGGISVTLTALEALQHRGYNVNAVIFINQSGDESEQTNNEDANIQFGYDNASALREFVSIQYLKKGSSIQVLGDSDDSIMCLSPLPPFPLPLDQWYDDNRDAFSSLHSLLANK